MPWTTPETFTAGQTLTAASMNIISGDLSYLYDELPRGYVAASKKTANQGSISTEVDITDLSVTVPMISGRIYKTTVHMDVFTSNSDTVLVGKLTDGSNVQLQRTTCRPAVANTGQTLQLVYYETAASTASVTRKIRVYRAAGTGTITVQGAALEPTLILVEDIGAA